MNYLLLFMSNKSKKQLLLLVYVSFLHTHIQYNILVNNAVLL
jgi:hypothetical protein